MMQKALYLNSLKGFRDTDSFKRIYFGNEFCRFLIPTEGDLRRCLSRISKKELTLTTPAVVNDYDIRRIKNLLNILEEEKPYSEVVFNNLGVLKTIQEYKTLKPVLGRILCKLVFYLSDKEIYLNDIDMVVFLRRYRVQRFELGNIERPIVNKTNISVTIHVPYLYMTTTRMCIFDNKQDVGRRGKCKINCTKSVNVKYPNIKEPVILKGNTQFLKKRVFLENITGVDRLVLTKGEPF